MRGGRRCRGVMPARTSSRENVASMALRKGRVPAADRKKLGVAGPGNSWSHRYR